MNPYIIQALECCFGQALSFLDFALIVPTFDLQSRLRPGFAKTLIVITCYYIVLSQDAGVRRDDGPRQKAAANSNPWIVGNVAHSKAARNAGGSVSREGGRRIEGLL